MTLQSYRLRFRRSPAHRRPPAPADYHRALFRWAEAVNPRLASMLRQGSPEFALAPLADSVRQNRGALEEELPARLNGLTPALNALLTDAQGKLDAPPETELPLSLASLELQSRAAMPYEALFRAHDSPALHTLWFRTPVVMRGRVSLPFPHPAWVWDGLLEHFNRVSTFPLPADLGAGFAQMEVWDYDLRTTGVRVGKERMRGFLGRCTYLCPRLMSEPLLHTIAALARFAAYAGVGSLTWCGYGLTDVRHGELEP